LEFADINCYPQFWNDTYIRCQLFQPLDGSHFMPVNLHVAGKGYAKDVPKFRYGVHILKIESANRVGAPAKGSRYGGDKLTLTMSANVIDKHPFSDEADALEHFVFMGEYDENPCHISSIVGPVVQCVTTEYVCPEVGCAEGNTDVVEPFLFISFNWEPWYVYSNASDNGAAKYTFLPRLSPSVDVSSTSSGGPPKTEAAADVISFTAVADAFKGWTNFTASDLVLEFGPNQCGSVMFDGSAGTCIVTGPVVPGQYPLNLTVCSSDYSCLQAKTVPDSKLVSVRHAVTGVTQGNPASIFGGLGVEISGTGFHAEAFSHATLAGVLCLDAEVVSSELITCTAGSAESALVGVASVYQKDAAGEQYESRCTTGSCGFEYALSNTPMIESPTFYADGNAGDTIQLDGTNLDGGTASQVFFGPEGMFEITDMIQQTATKIKARLPEAPAGHHKIYIFVPGRGFSRTQVFKYGLVVTSTSPTSFSLCVKDYQYYDSYYYCMTSTS